MLLPFFFSSFPLFSHYAINLIVIIFAIAYWYNSSSILMQIRCRDWPKASIVKCISMPLTNPRPTFNWYSIDTLVHTWSVLDQYNIFCRQLLPLSVDPYIWVGQASLTIDWLSVECQWRCWLSVNWMLAECWSRCWWSVHQGPIEGIDGHSTTDAFSSHDPFFSHELRIRCLRKTSQKIS